jgi:hypothetical protein
MTSLVTWIFFAWAIGIIVVQFINLVSHSSIYHYVRFSSGGCDA